MTISYRSETVIGEAGRRLVGDGDDELRHHQEASHVHTLPAPCFSWGFPIKRLFWEFPMGQDRTALEFIRGSHFGNTHMASHQAFSHPQLSFV